MLVWLGHFDIKLWKYLKQILCQNFGMLEKIQKYGTVENASKMHQKCPYQKSKKSQDCAQLQQLVKLFFARYLHYSMPRILCIPFYA